MRIARDIAVTLLLIVLTVVLLVGVLIGVQSLLHSHMGGGTSNIYDVNGDGRVDVLDVQLIVNEYLGRDGVPLTCPSIMSLFTVTPTLVPCGRSTVTPTVVVCECDVTETPLVPTATPPATETPRTPEPTDPPESTSTPRPTNTVPAPTNTSSPEPTNPPQPTERVKCDRGLGNGATNCDPGNSTPQPGGAGERNEPDGPSGKNGVSLLQWLYNWFTA